MLRSLEQRLESMISSSGWDCWLAGEMEDLPRCVATTLLPPGFMQPRTM